MDSDVGNKFDQLSSTFNDVEPIKDLIHHKTHYNLIKKYQLIVNITSFVLPFEIKRGKKEDDRFQYIFYNPFKTIYAYIILFIKRFRSNSEKSHLAEIAMIDSKNLCPIRIYLLHILNLYAVIKLSSIAFYQLKYEKLSIDYHPSVRFGANQTDLCALKSDIIEPMMILKRLEMVTTKLSELGSCFTILNDYSTLTFTVTSLVIIILYCGSLLYRKSALIIDSLSFIMDPVRERKRLKLDLYRNIESIFNCHDNELGHRRKDSIQPRHSIGKLSTNINVNDRLARVTSSCSCRFRERFRRESYLTSLKEHDVLERVLPAHRRKRALDQIVKVQLFIFFLMIITCCFVSVTVHWTLFARELHDRIKRRILLIDCFKWNPNATLINDPTKVFFKILDHEYPYGMLVNLSMTDLRSRLISIELPYMLENGWIQLGFEMSVLSITSGVWGANYVKNAIGSLLTRNIWIQQLRKQLQDCIKLMEYYAYLNDSLEHIEMKSIRKKKLEDALSITYLNFSLFRSEMTSHRTIQNFYSDQLLAFTFGNLLFSYLILSSVDSKNQSAIYSVTISVLTLTNIFIIVCSVLTERTQGLFHYMNEILAKASSNSMELSYIIDVWRRQILTDDQVENAYSIKAYGLNLSSSNLIAFNSSVLGIWLLIYRQVG